MKVRATLLFLCVLAGPGLSHAAGSPKCPPGEGPQRLKQGWSCGYGLKWLWGDALQPSDCPSGTSLTPGFPTGMDPACLPPAPCVQGFTAFPDALQPSGWRCLKRAAERPNCPQGSAPLRDEYGWQCEPGLYWPSGPLG